MATVFQGAITTGSPTITAVANTTTLAVGNPVVGEGIPLNAKIISTVRNKSVTLSLNATADITLGDFVIALAKRTGCSLRTTADAVKLDLQNVTVRRTGVALRTSADAVKLDLVLVTVHSSRASLLTSASAELLNLREVTVQVAGAELFSGLVAFFNITGGSDTDGMTVGDVIDDLVRLCGYRSRCGAPADAIARAINDINLAMQTVWNQAKDRDYWTNVTLPITLANGQFSSALPDDVQNVVGPCRRADSGRILANIGTIGEFENFAGLYLSGRTVTEPVAYHIKRDAHNSPGLDSALCTLLVTPPVSGASITFSLDVVKEAPRYTKYEVEGGNILPIPHSYTESLLLPIARYHMSNSHFFRDKENKESIQREYLRAAAALGLADPLPGMSGDNRGFRKGDAA